MRISLLPAALALTTWCHLTSALLSFDAMRNLTELTDECRSRILEVGSIDGVEIEVDAMAAVLNGGGQSQTVLRGGDEEGEVEDTVAASLHLLCSEVLIELEKPLSAYMTAEGSEQNCTRITGEYHAFLGATVRFLYVVQEREMRFRWGGESAVFGGVAWLQGLWASRKTNKQERSFIEQQMTLYAEGGCFGKNEVLRRGVEVVEYLNDLVDMFG